MATWKLGLLDAAAACWLQAVDTHLYIAAQKEVGGQTQLGCSHCHCPAVVGLDASSCDDVSASLL